MDIYKDTITKNTEKNGYYLFEDCAFIKPYIFIVGLNIDKSYNEIVNQSESKEVKLDFSLDIKNVNGEEKYQLQNITTLAQKNNAQVAINGFEWSGDIGINYTIEWYFTYKGLAPVFVDSTLFGIPNGKTIYHDKILQYNKIDNSKKIYIPMALGISSTNNIKLFSIKDNELPYSPYKYNLLISKHQILYNNECNPNVNELYHGANNQWSAIGIKYGKVLLISSNYAYGETNIYEMCKIFKKLGFSNALRLDGGSATSLVVDNKHLNPLSGLKRIILMGESRKLLYAITAKVKE